MCTFTKNKILNFGIWFPVKASTELFVSYHFLYQTEWISVTVNLPRMLKTFRPYFNLIWFCGYISLLILLVFCIRSHIAWFHQTFDSLFVTNVYKPLSSRKYEWEICIWVFEMVSQRGATVNTYRCRLKSTD